MAVNAPIRITFDRAMDQASVASRLELQPAVAGCEGTGCPVTWEGDTAVIAHTGHEFASATRYTVILRAGYRDSAARAASADHSWSFTTEDAPTLRASNPANGATRVAVDADIQLRFSRRMQLPRESQLSFSPAVVFRVALDPADPSHVVISPLRLLLPATTYQLTIDADLADEHDNHLAAPATFTFATGATDLSRTISFTALDTRGLATKIAVLRPPASLAAPPPTVRVLYESGTGIADYAWSADAVHVYIQELPAGGTGAPPHLRRMAVDTSQVDTLPFGTAMMAASPVGDELAYVDDAGLLHLWQPAGGGVDVAVPQAGRVQQRPAWSGDGRRLALAVQTADGSGLAVLDRGTLSRSTVPGIIVSDRPDLAWSFDGRALAFSRAVEGGDEAWIYRPLETGTAALLRLGRYMPAGVAWSDDGSLLYAAGVPDTTASMARVPTRIIGGQAPVFSAIAGSKPGDSAPAVAVYDRRIAFLRATAGIPQVWLMNGDGTGVVQLSFGDYFADAGLVAYGAGRPQWVPAARGG